MSGNIRIRKAAASDYPALAELSIQLGYQDLPENIKNRLEELLIREDDHIVFAAELDNSVVVPGFNGYLYRLFYMDTACEIGEIVVDEVHCKLGIGKELMAAIEKWAVEKGCNRVSLRSNIIRKGAHQFYQNLGFDLVKTQYCFIKEVN